MQTSNFFIKGSDLNSVSISRITPSWYRGRRYELLAPPMYLVQGYMSNAIGELHFTRVYKERVLSTLDPFEVIKDLGMSAILLGNAKLGKFCHRLLVAKWLEDTLGIRVPECSESIWLWP